ncbi:O-antigen ligase family protein [Enterococcus lactis]|uniref:O-antigen ligase family protein n=1 Tax=Enterococcus lactis TaxID=357441 RepID=UPI00288C8CE4|nr:O-antigen ligase family protein [Enterococcus lactis]MDT2791622.1 O-antigen ligase family protein [Enterococcus lactis]
MKAGQRLYINWVFPLMYFILIILGFSQEYGIRYGNVFISLLIASIICILPVETVIILLYLLFPFFNIFSVEIGSNSYFYVYVFIFIFKYLKKIKWKLNRKKIIVLFLAFFLTIFWLNISVQIKWLLLFSLLLINYNNTIFIERLPQIIKCINISTIISSMIGYVMLISGNSIYTNSYIYTETGNVTRFAGLVGDSVFYGQFTVIIIGLTLAMILEKEISKIFGYITCMILSIFVVLTYSKTAIILLIVVVFLYFAGIIMANIKYKKTFYKSLLMFVFVSLFILSGVIYVINHLNNPLINMYVIRFTSADLWTGRTYVTENYLEKFSSSLLYYFVGMPYSKYTENGVLIGETIITRAHNIYIETICLFGVIPAVVIFAFCMKKIYIHLRKGQSYYICIPFFILLLSGISLHGHLEWPYYFLVTLCLAIIEFRQKKREEGINQ